MPDDHFHVPSAEELGRAAYRAYTIYVGPRSTPWPSWDELTSEDHGRWEFIGLIVANEVQRANEHA